MKLKTAGNHSVRLPLRADMSVDGTVLLFEGFLEKRKDTMKTRWVTYWFRLQNTTLFFYTKKNGRASDLKGNYYIYTVQSVREVQRKDSKRFMFEIMMTNGKRKLLGAETEALRHEWVRHLWQAMQLSSSGVSDYRGTLVKVREQRERTNSIVPIRPHSGSMALPLPARPLSAPTGHIITPSHHRIRSIAVPIRPSEELHSEETVYQNMLPVHDNQHQNVDGPTTPSWPSDSSNVIRPEGDYDVLPMRKKMLAVEASSDKGEGIYDSPISYRKPIEHPGPKESIYDVPSNLLRRISDHTSVVSSEGQPEDGLYWRI